MESVTYNAILEEGREEGREEGLEKGLEKGREEGREEGLKQALTHQRDLLLRMLAARFGAVVAAVQQQIAHASQEQLDQWLLRILSASSLEDVFASEA